MNSNHNTQPEQANLTSSVGCKSAKLQTVNQFCENNPAFTIGGVRHIQFMLGDELAKTGAIVRFGRKLLIDEDLFIDFVKSGKATKIAGGKQS